MIEREPSFNKNIKRFIITPLLYNYNMGWLSPFDITRVSPCGKIQVIESEY